MLERFVLDQTEGRQDEVMFLSICHTGTALCRGAALLDTGLGYGERETFSKEPPSTSPCLSPFSDLSAFHSSPAQYFIGVQTAKKEEKKKRLRAKRRDQPISLKDLTNAIRQRFISELPLNGF